LLTDQTILFNFLNIFFTHFCVRQTKRSELYHQRSLADCTNSFAFTREVKTNRSMQNLTRQKIMCIAQKTKSFNVFLKKERKLIIFGQKEITQKWSTLMLLQNTIIYLINLNQLRLCPVI